MARSLLTRFSLLVAAAAFAAPASAGAAPVLVPVGTFDAPIYATSPPRDTSRLFVVERSGVIKVVDGRGVRAAPFANISSVVATDGERGLLSIAFPPDYATSGLMYVYMVAKVPAGELQVRELHRSAADPDTADPGPGRVVWRQAHNEASNHNGGQIQFGPDGLLWLAPGDGGGSNDQFNHAQDLNSQLGKILRIDPRPDTSGRGYTIPPDNPYVGMTGRQPTVWAAGLRNPFRFSFDRMSGDLVIGDVGQGAREEVDWVRRADGLGRGGNFGWACREGAAPGPKACIPSSSPVFEPVFDYSQGSPRAVTGGYVVRDPRLPSLYGRYVYADTYAGDVRSLVLADARASERSAGLPVRKLLVSFGEDAEGHLYVISLNGTVERVVDPAAEIEPTATPAAPATATPSAPDATPQGFADRTALVLTLGGARRQRLGSTPAIRLTVRCSEACSLASSLRVAGVRVRRTVRLPASRAIGVRLRFSRAQAARVRRSLRRHRSLPVRVSARATDAAGNAGSATRRVRVGR